MILNEQRRASSLDVNINEQRMPRSAVSVHILFHFTAHSGKSLEVYLLSRKHAYSNILKISPPKTESFQIKILTFFHIFAQNIDCGYPLEPPRRGGSNEYPQFIYFELK